MKLDDAQPDELVFVFDSWSRSFRKSPYAGCIRNCDYEPVMRNAMTELIDGGARVLVGWTPTEEGERRIIGYSVSDPGRLHWLFVKRDWRGIGFGRQLLDATVNGWTARRWTYTFRTHASSHFLGDRFRWDPVPARVRYREGQS